MDADTPPRDCAFAGTKPTTSGRIPRGETSLLLSATKQCFLKESMTYYTSSKKKISTHISYTNYY